VPTAQPTPVISTGSVKDDEDGYRAGWLTGYRSGWQDAYRSGWQEGHSFTGQGMGTAADRGDAHRSGPSESPSVER
jgi:hypothetical protein